MPILIFIFLFLIMGCTPEKDVPSNAKKVYTLFLKIMEEGKEPPPEVQKVFDMFKDSTEVENE